MGGVWLPPGCTRGGSPGAMCSPLGGAPAHATAGLLWPGLWGPHAIVALATGPATCRPACPMPPSAPAATAWGHTAVGRHVHPGWGARFCGKCCQWAYCGAHGPQPCMFAPVWPVVGGAARGTAPGIACPPSALPNAVVAPVNWWLCPGWWAAAASAGGSAGLGGPVAVGWRRAAAGGCGGKPIHAATGQQWPTGMLETTQAQIL